MAKKQKSAAPAAKSEAPAAQKTAVPAPKERKVHPTPGWIIYGIGFILTAIFCCYTYGEVFQQIAAQNFVCADAEAMTFVRRLPFAGFIWAARYVLLLFLNRWVGGLLMAALLTLTAWLFDRCLGPKSRFAPIFRGAGFLPVFALLSWFVFRGFNLYFRCEISTFVLCTLGLFALALVCGGIAMLLTHYRSSKKAPKPLKASLWTNIPEFALISLVVYGGLTYQAIVLGENVRISCQMQNLMADQEWEAMADVARTAKQPTRTVAGLYNVALVQMDQLLEHCFDIPYNYPKLTLDDVGGADEGINYIADCNLYAGLPNSAYRTSMENLVMIGPRVHHYKRMALCAILNGEDKLAERYLHLIGSMPFQQDFVDTYRPYVGHPELVAKNPMFARILELAPREHNLEQNYRQPIFLGYNAGLMTGSDATLKTSIATCMYSKDINSLLLRTNFLQQKQSLPLSVQQSLAIASLRRPGLLDKYPQVKANAMLMQELQRFVQEGAPYVAQPDADDETKKKAKADMAANLRDNWLGSYYYYYYCGNIEQTAKKTVSQGVN